MSGRRGNVISANEAFDSGDRIDGEQVIELGDSDGPLIIRGHVPAEKAEAVFLAYARVMWDSTISPDDLDVSPQHRWARFTSTSEGTRDLLGFGFMCDYRADAYKPGRTAITVVSW